MKKLLSVLLVFLMVLSIAACSSKEPDKQKESGAKDVDTSKSVEEDDPSAKTEPKDTEPPQAVDFKVALCLTGPANDGGWCQLAYDGLEAAKEKYGISFSYTENLQTTEMEAAMTDYAAQGYDMVLGLGFQFGDPAMAVGKKYPDCKFVVFEGNVQADNVLSCQIGNQQSRYLLGVLAARLSKTGTVGFVAGVSQPAIIKVAEAFKLGARTANPDIKVLITYVESFTDVALGKEAAIAMIDAGADVIAHGANTAGTGAIKACEERGVLAMGGSADQNFLAPNTVVCSDTYSYGDVLLYVVGQAIDGIFEGGIKFYGFAEGVVELSSYNSFEDKIPTEVKQEIEDLKQQIIDGTLKVPLIETPTE